MPSHASVVATICVVDDDDGVRIALRRLFEISGYFVRDYVSGEAFFADVPALEKACLVLDFHLPGDNGLDVLKRVRRHGWSVPVVMLTGNDDKKLEAEALAEGANAFVRKPVDALALVSQVVKLLDR